VVAERTDAPALGELYNRGSCGALWKPVDCIEAIRMIRTVDQAARDRRYVWQHS
jgi:hypothetical protein